jgi:hypothetical protein
MASSTFQCPINFLGWARDGIQCQKSENIPKYSLVSFFKKKFFEKLFLMKISTLLKVNIIHVITAKLLGYHDKVENSCKIGTIVCVRERESLE